MASIIAINNADRITQTTDEGGGICRDLVGSPENSAHPVVAGVWHLGDIDGPTPAFEAEWDEVKFLVAGETRISRIPTVLIRGSTGVVSELKAGSLLWIPKGSRMCVLRSRGVRTVTHVFADGVLGCLAHMLGVTPNRSETAVQFTGGFGYASFWHWLLQRPDKGPYLCGLATAEKMGVYDDTTALERTHPLHAEMLAFLSRMFPHSFGPGTSEVDICYDWTGVQDLRWMGVVLLGGRLRREEGSLWLWDITGRADLDDALQTFNSMPTPLALYVFSRQQSEIDRVLDSTNSGGVTVNDIAVHNTVVSAPFGGVGESGYGAYHGKWGFDTFSHNRTVVHMPGWVEWFVGWRYPPYDMKNRGEVDPPRPRYKKGETMEDQKVGRNGLWRLLFWW
ncbi:hypothetical protein BDW74DRAFT_172917 [Aspergillus multicolor]|uniref:uncharacterized protein n=1 Tax=Aspergillus multicolor TaxID=41759 RepID=UPI003CCDE6AF